MELPMCGATSKLTEKSETEKTEIGLLVALIDLDAHWYLSYADDRLSSRRPLSPYSYSTS